MALILLTMAGSTNGKKRNVVKAKRKSSYADTLRCHYRTFRQVLGRKGELPDTIPFAKSLEEVLNGPREGKEERLVRLLINASAPELLKSRPARRSEVAQRRC